jgi:hypothetical protein
VRSPLVVAVLALGGVAGCASKPSGSASSGTAPAAQVPVRPLAGYAGLRTIVVPVQALRASTVQGLEGAQGRAVRDSLDKALADSIGARGLRGTWTFADAVVRSAKRNPTYAADPYTLAAGQVREAAARRRDDIPLADPVAMQLRTLVGLQDSRYALVPLDLRFEPVTGGVRASMTLALVDARAARVAWAGEVSAAPVADLTPAVAATLVATLGGRVADLIAPH